MRRPWLPVLAALLSTVAGSAGATPIPPYAELLAQRRVEPSAWAPGLSFPKPLSSPLYVSTRVLSIDTKLDLVPSTGVLQGHVDVKVEALSSVGQLSLLLDVGLTATAASASGKSIGITNQAYQGYTLATFDLSPALAQGEVASISVDYSGTLACGGGTCHAGSPLAYLAENGPIPGVYDQDNLGGYNAWGASRSVEISVADGVDVVASGDLKSKQSAGGKTTSRWEIPGFQSYGGNIVMLGALAETPVSGVSLPTRVVTTAAGPKYTAEWTGWMKNILPFIDEQSGQKLPYAELKVFKLPTGWLNIFRGTAGFGLTLLSEDYASGTPQYFEETLAHENSHQWWGVLVSPTDVLTTRWLVEGLATLSQIDYSAKFHHADVPRDEYLARRYREHWMLVKYLGDPSLPLVVGSQQEIPQDSIGNTLWAYIRSSAFLEYLRVVVGDDVFASVLRSWAKDCAKQLCDTADFLALIEKESGQDFDPVFAQWVYAGTAAEPRIAFSQAGGALAVTAANIDALVVPLELIIELEDGTLKKQSVRFEGGKALTLPVTGTVRRVRPNPRQDGVIWSRSAVDGDVDFDGEVDGLDVIHCAWRLGRVADPSQPGGEGIWSSDLDFDPRCDADGNGSIGDSDITFVTQAFSGPVKGGG